MLTKETKRHIDNARDILVGQLPLPSDQVELITIALIYKFMDDIDEASKKLGAKATYFKGDLANLSWRKLISNELGAEERVTKLIGAMEEIAKAKHIPELFKGIFKNTFLKFRDGRTLKLFMDEISFFEYSHSEELGNAFEYLLSSMGTQGENGQFRTPRNIIDFLVDVVDPTKDETILDPACGTAGFLISAYKHILWKNTKGFEDYSPTLKNHDIEGKPIRKGDKLTQDERQKLMKNIVGYDITPLMVRLSKVNMYLHEFANPVIHEYDTLTNDNRWNDKFDCILANPPFMTPKGGVEPHDKFRICANTTEVLFSDYMLEHLTPNGKAGWIVPEGIIFQNNNDYVDLRRWLIEEAGLWGVVSLPSQIFQPYSGVKTSILLVDRKLARERDSIMLVKVENDGFSLNTNRTPIGKNDLPDALKILRAFKENRLPKTKEETQTGMKYLVLPRKEFEKIDSYKAYTTAWEFCKKAYTRVAASFSLRNDGNADIAPEAHPPSAEKSAPTTDKEKKRSESLWQRRWEEFVTLTNYNKNELGSEQDFKLWFDENLKDAGIAYGEDPHAKLKKKGIYFPDALKKKLDNEREYNLSFDKYNGNAKGISQNGKWPLARLSTLCQIQTGKKDVNYQDPNGIYTFFTCAAEPFKAPDFSFQGESIIMPGNGANVGMVFYYDGKFEAYQRTYVLNNFSEGILSRFVFYVLQAKWNHYISDKQYGSATNYIVMSSIQDFEIPLPPLKVQQKIVAEIEGYQKVIDGCTAVIENYKPTFKVDEKWEEYRLGEIFDNVKDLCNPQSLHRKVNYVGLENIEAESGGLVGDVEHDSQTIKSTKVFFKPNDILLGKLRPNLNKVWLSNLEGICSTDILVLRQKTDSVNPFLFSVFFRTPEFNSEILNGVKGAQLPRVSFEHIANIEIPFPPVSVQQTITSSLQTEQQAIEHCKHLKAKMEAKIKEMIDGVWGEKIANNP